MPGSDTKDTKQQQPEIPLEQYMTYKLNFLSGILARQLERYLKQHHNIAVPDYRALAILASMGSMSVRELSAYSKMDKALVSRAVSRLVDNKLVQRQPDPQDGRLVTLTITKEGDALFARIKPFAQQRQQRLREVLEEDERAIFFQALDKLIDFAESDSQIKT